MSQTYTVGSYQLAAISDVLATLVQEQFSAGMANATEAPRTGPLFDSETSARAAVDKLREIFGMPKPEARAQDDSWPGSGEVSWATLRMLDEKRTAAEAAA